VEYRHLSRLGRKRIVVVPVSLLRLATNVGLPSILILTLTGTFWPARDCLPSGLAALKLPFANYGTRPVAVLRVCRKRSLKPLRKGDA
jgi:hypothetical protein